MIEYNKKEFLNPTIVKKLIDNDINLSDSRYVILEGEELVERSKVVNKKILSPTYTLSELLYKLPECIFDESNDFVYSLNFFKDAPFYCFTYSKEGVEKFVSIDEYPVSAAGLLLLQLSKSEFKGLIVNDISDK